MWAGCRVDAFVGEAQSRYGFSLHQMHADDFLNVAFPHKSVPDGVGINDDGDAVLALVEATGDIDANRAVQSGAANEVFQGLANPLGTFLTATAARMASRPLIRADEYVSFKARQSSRSFVWHRRLAGELGCRPCGNFLHGL